MTTLFLDIETLPAPDMRNPIMHTGIIPAMDGKEMLAAAEECRACCPGGEHSVQAPGLPKHVAEEYLLTRGIPA